MSVRGPITIERAEDYMPAFFVNGDGNAAHRVYTHPPCKKSASYSTLQFAREYDNNKCPMCLYKGFTVNATNIIPNEGLSKSISNFLQNFNLRNDDDGKSSYDLARHLFTAEDFEYVIKICIRALGLEPKDPILNEHLRIILDRVNQEFNKVLVKEQGDIESVESQPDLKKMLEGIKALEIDLDHCLSKLKNPEEENKTYLIHFVAQFYNAIGEEKDKVARVFLENNLNQKAIDYFKEAVESFNKGLEYVQEVPLREIIIINLASSLAHIGDFFEIIKDHFQASESYEKAMKILKANEELYIDPESENKKTYLISLDRCYLKLSLSCIAFADQSNLQKGKLEKTQYSSAIEYYVKAKQAIEQINKKTDQINEILHDLDNKLRLARINEKMAV